jgi:uncharacterized protein YggE
MLTTKDQSTISRTNMKHPIYFLVSILILTGLMSSSLAATQLPFAQAQTIEDEDNQETQQATADVNATQTVTQGNETIVDNGNFGREEDADGSLASLSTLSITSTSTAEVRPDRLSVSVGVETNGTTAQEAVSQNANLTSQVIAALTGLGITEDRIETSSYSVSPIYEYIQPAEPCIQIYPPPPGCETRQEIIGYRATNTVSVTLDVPFFRVAAESSVPDVNAGQVIDAVVGAGANRVDSVTFFISPERQEEIRGTLIGEAISNARQRANIAAEALQMTITGVSSAEINPIDFPVYTVSLREATGAGEAADALSAPTQILPGQQEVSTTVSIVFYLGQEGTTNG